MVVGLVASDVDLIRKGFTVVVVAEAVLHATFVG